MKKFCSCLKKESKGLIFIFFVVILGPNLFAQEEQTTINSFDDIPESVQKRILIDLLNWEGNDTDSLSIQFTDSLSRGVRNIYSYEILREGNQLKGIYSRKLECDYCMLERNFWSYDLDLRFFYCCKDPDHDPAEVELTEEKMKKIQKEKNCKKIGICLKR